MKHSLWWIDKKNSTGSVFYSTYFDNTFKDYISYENIKEPFYKEDSEIYKEDSEIYFQKKKKKKKQKQNKKKDEDESKPKPKPKPKPTFIYRIVNVGFKKPYPVCGQYVLIALILMKLLLKYVYNRGFYNGKFTIGYTVLKPGGEPNYSVLGTAISLYDEKRKKSHSIVFVYTQILSTTSKRANEIYGNDALTGLTIRLYLNKDEYNSKIREYPIPHSEEEIDQFLYELRNANIDEVTEEVTPIEKSRKRLYVNYITKLKSRSKERRSFIVADTETVMLMVKDKDKNDISIQVPYAVGFLVVNPGADVGAMPDHSCETYFSEDYSSFIDDFQERSNRMMFDFLERLAVVTSERKIRTVYFHNFGRFDGILIVKYYVSYMVKYKIKPLLRNNMIYELAVYRDDKYLFRFRDSLCVFPRKLADLGKTLCPNLGTKGSIEHKGLQVDHLMDKRSLLLEYLKQDIRILGGVMVKGQEIYWSQFNVDIENCMTLSSLAISIFRRQFYDPKSWPICIPNGNEDTFIRRGYYGGHADAYKPKGENLYYYDVNSLYPFIMQKYDMPGGIPVWHNKLYESEKDLSELYGFIEAYVSCPSTINRPFLPYRDKKSKTLLFPTGHFVGVYFSEELIYARDKLGYTIIPLWGYLFERKPSPFADFVSTLYNNRMLAKKEGNEPMVFVYKTLMNSLYGRFGINPESVVTEICGRKRFETLVAKERFIIAEELNEKYNIISYVTDNDSELNQHRISAVQLSAAITACARIHMYDYIKRDDCYYTDTDSAVLGNELPQDEISSVELGKLKLEHFVLKGYFLAPKTYTLLTQEKGKIIKHKGAGKGSVDFEWFEKQLADPSRKMKVKVESPFQIDWNNLLIKQKTWDVTLGTKTDSKRKPFYVKNVWVDTTPKDVYDITGYENLITPLLLKHQKEKFDKKENEYAHTIDSKNLELAKLREKVELLSAGKHPEEPVMSPLPELQPPTHYKPPTKVKKKKRILKNVDKNAKKQNPKVKKKKKPG